MVRRCTNPNHTSFVLYGGRGIGVCERWRSFENFLADMGRKPSSEHSIDRIDPSGNYEPSNCRWANRKEQQRNRRNNKLIAFRGKAQCLAAWAEETGIHEDALEYRFRVGWPAERALTIPSRKKK